VKSRGRIILSDGRSQPETESITESDDDGLGGYGFFDAGMLLSALKAKDEVEPVERDAIKRNIGRRLTLSEY